MNILLKRENKKLLIVGLTGGIGSGKSTVAKVFQSLGVPVFNSDLEAKNIINNDFEVINKVIAQFGAVYEGGKLNAQKLSEVVFNDKNALEKLNKIVHPKVAEYFEQWVLDNKSEPVLIKEAAILIESGAYKHVDKIILVTAPEELRLERVVNRDAASEEKVKSRIKTQLSDKEKLTYADYTIVNDDKQMVIPQVLKVTAELTE